MYVRIVDEEGFYIEDSFVEELTEYTIETPCVHGFYKPKWCFLNKQWIEGLSEDEIKALKDTVIEEADETLLLNNRVEMLEEMLMLLMMTASEGGEVNVQ